MDERFNIYARITPYGIVVAMIIGYVITGGIWWGIPIIAAVGFIYAVIRVRMARRMSHER